MVSETVHMKQGSISPFNQDGVWLRCNLHAHTTNSDGMLPPDMLKRYYWLGDCDVLAITDHDQLTPPPDATDDYNDLIVIRGTEISLRTPVTGGPLHLLGIGIEEMPQVSENATLAEATCAVKKAGGIAIVAHPWWSGISTEELGVMEGVAAIEVFNAGCEVTEGRGVSSQYWDSLLSRGVRVNAIATDDHHLPGFDSFRGWTMVKARERTAEAVLDALRRGHFYSSRGPSFHDIRFEDHQVIVETSPVAAISAVAQPPYGGRVNAGANGLTSRGKSDYTLAGRREGSIDGEMLTRVRFPLSLYPELRYVRFEAIDEYGRHAWSNPVWLR